MSRRLLLVALLLAGSAHAAMYKWVDADGNVQYTAFPPPDRPATTIAPPPRVAPPPATTTADDGEPAAKSPDEARGGGAPAADIRQKNCMIARQNLDVYKTARRIKQGDEYVYLDDAARQKGVAEAQANVEQYCK